MDTESLIKRLIDARLVAVNQEKAVMADVEARGGEWSAQDDRIWDRANAEVDTLDVRIKELIDLEVRNKEADEQRKPLNAIIRPNRGNMGNETELTQWLRRGGEPHYTLSLKDSERRDLTKTTGAATVPLGFVGEFFQHVIATAAVRQTNAQVITTGSGEPLVIPKSTTDPTAALVAEAGAIGESDPVFGGPTLGAFKYGVLTQLTNELVEDTSVDIQAILARLLGRAIGTAQGAHLVTGTGSGQPQGVALSPVDGVVTTWTLLVAGATGPDLLTDMYHSVNPGYRPEATWFMNDATLSALRKLKDTTNQPLLNTNPSGPFNETLFGRPIVTDPNVATGAGTGTRILFGNFADYYVIRDVDGLRLERSDDFAFANDLVTYRALLRSDAKQVLNDAANAAVKALRITA